MPTITEKLRVASVYRFGSVWHWKCGMSATDGPDSDGTCLGGRAHTEQEARGAAEAHIAEEHTRILYVPVAIEGCRHCGVEVSEHGVRDDVTVGVHEWRAPTVPQRVARRRHARPLTNEED